MLMSVILGLGIASLFREVCKNKRCIEFHAPPLEELKDKNLSQLLIYSGIYNIRDKVYANLCFKILITFENEKYSY